MNNGPSFRGIRRASLQREENRRASVRRKSAVFAAGRPGDGAAAIEATALARFEHEAEKRYLLGRVASVSFQGIVVVMLMCYAAGFVFWLLERDSQRDDRRSYKAVARAVRRVETMATRDELEAARSAVRGGHANATALVGALLDRTPSAEALGALRLHRLGFPRKEGEAFRQWRFLSNCVFFAQTVVTTIGYGSYTPSTAGGRLFCSAFAFVGICALGYYLNETSCCIRELIICASGRGPEARRANPRAREKDYVLAEFDGNTDGVLDKEETFEMVRRVREDAKLPALEDCALEEFWAAVDRDGSGSIEWNEFQVAVRMACADETSEDVYWVKLFWATALFLFAISTEVVLMMVAYDCAAYSLVDAVYCAVSTLTTIGLGDLVPEGVESGCGGPTAFWRSTFGIIQFFLLGFTALFIQSASDLYTVLRFPKEPDYDLIKDVIAIKAEKVRETMGASTRHLVDKARASARVVLGLPTGDAAAERAAAPRRNTYFAAAAADRGPPAPLHRSSSTGSFVAPPPPDGGGGGLSSPVTTFHDPADIDPGAPETGRRRPPATAPTVWGV